MLTLKNEFLRVDLYEGGWIEIQFKNDDGQWDEINVEPGLTCEQLRQFVEALQCPKSP